MAKVVDSFRFIGGMSKRLVKSWISLEFPREIPWTALSRHDLTALWRGLAPAGLLSRRTALSIKKESAKIHGCELLETASLGFAETVVAEHSATAVTSFQSFSVRENRDRMSSAAAHNRWWHTSEVVLGIPFLASIALRLVVPLSLPSGFLALIIIPSGVALIILGVTLVVLARREFAKRDADRDRGRDSQGVL